jgi:hypothetical protein
LIEFVREILPVGRYIQEVLTGSGKALASVDLPSGSSGPLPLQGATVEEFVERRCLLLWLVGDSL